MPGLHSPFQLIVHVLHLKSGLHSPFQLIVHFLHLKSGLHNHFQESKWVDWKFTMQLMCSGRHSNVVPMHAGVLTWTF